MTKYTKTDLNEIVTAHIKNYLAVASQEFEEELLLNYKEIHQDKELSDEAFKILDEKLGRITLN